MRISELGLIFSFLVMVLGLPGLLLAIALRKRRLAVRLSRGLAIYAGLYALLLIGFSLLSPQRILSMHEVRCFDDWCAAVERVEQRPAIGSLQAHGSFFLVTLTISSQAKRIRQRALDAAVSLLDEHGNRYFPSEEAQKALESAGQAGQPLNSWLEVGESFSHTAVFDLPPDATRPGLVVSHGAFPGLIIIGDEQSFLHKRTIVRLDLP